MATSLLSPNAKQQFFDNAGVPAAGYKLHTYAANTLVPQATYQNRAGTSANDNPITLDARGEAVIYLPPGVVYDYELKTAAGVSIWTRQGITADAGDSDAVSFLQAGTGAVSRTVQDKLRERVSALDFIPVAEHAAIKAYTTTYDATLDLQNAIDSLPGGGRLYFPDGLYQLSAPLTVSAAGVTLEGDTPWKCALQQTDLGLGILTLESTANNTNVRNLRFSYVAGTPTGGFAIDSQGGYNHIDNIVISQCHGGVKLSVGAGQKLTNFDIFNYESIGVQCDTINDILISDFVMNAGTIARGQLGGIRLNNKAEAIMVNRGDILLGKYSLTTDASLYSIGVRPAYCNFTDVFFDSSERGSVIDKMVESEFIGCWFSGGRTAPGYPGLTLNQSDSLKFTNTRFFNNGSHGLSVTSTTKRLALSNCSANSNSVTVGAGISHGLFFGASVTDFSITGCTSTNGLYTGTQGYGIYLTAGCDNFAIRDNLLSGNATGAINDLATAAVQKYIAGNIGYRTHQNYTVTVAVGTSSTVVAHGFPFTPSASDFAMAPVGSPAASSIATYWISGLGATNFTVNTNANVAGTAFNIAVTVRSKGS